MNIERKLREYYCKKVGKGLPEKGRRAVQVYLSKWNPEMRGLSLSPEDFAWAVDERDERGFPFLLAPYTHNGIRGEEENERRRRVRSWLLTQLAENAGAEAAYVELMGDGVGDRSKVFSYLSKGARLEEFGRVVPLQPVLARDAILALKTEGYTYVIGKRTYRKGDFKEHDMLLALKTKNYEKALEYVKKFSETEKVAEVVLNKNVEGKPAFAIGEDGLPRDPEEREKPYTDADASLIAEAARLSAGYHIISSAFHNVKSVKMDRWLLKKEGKYICVYRC